MRIVNRRAGGYLLNEEDEVELFEYWLLSVDEEYAMARWVMDVLCLQWIDTKPAFQRFMFGLFIRKAEGKENAGAQVDNHGSGVFGVGEDPMPQ